MVKYHTVTDVETGKYLPADRTRNRGVLRIIAHKHHSPLAKFGKLTNTLSHIDRVEIICLQIFIRQYAIGKIRFALDSVTRTTAYSEFACGDTKFFAYQNPYSERLMLHVLIINVTWGISVSPKYNLS